MKKYSAFDILGPIMIGPSSSHTAGAARLGKVASCIAGGDFNEVTFYLHGSFAHTYRGHGTDKALVAGVLGMEPYDERLRNSIEIAENLGIKINFETIELDDVHPNTAKMVFHKLDGNKTEIIGSSIGGGSIIIISVDGYVVDLTGDYPALIIRQQDKEGVISNVSKALVQGSINVAKMKVTRNTRGKEAFMIIECDNKISENLVKEISSIENIISVRGVNPVSDSM